MQNQLAKQVICCLLFCGFGLSIWDFAACPRLRAARSVVGWQSDPAHSQQTSIL